ncbi:outer membrane beta-barrel protein [Salinarimonas sp.]|uniref:outer membrane protein n=1 Tax=Salinarimonas sp. TaxID=2766526 RepID=UPI0032D92DF9
MRAASAATLALLALGPTTAGAADLDLGPLRGSYGAFGLEPVVRWQGGYFAGTAGYTSGQMTGSGSVGDLIARHLRGTTIEAEMQVSRFLQPQIPDQRDTTYGFLAGYNFQFGETVLGVEADMTLGRLGGTGSDALGRSRLLSDGYFATAITTGSVTAEIENWATLRARAGYTLGAFLPFVTGGFAVAQYEVASRATVDTSYVDPSGTLPPLDPPLATLSESDSGIAFGLSAGAGVDVALTENVFLRGEWQYLYFPDVAGADVVLNTVRGAAGVKF